MLKLYLKLRALKDIPTTGWREGDYCEITTNVFDKKNGLGYYPLDKEWEVVKMEILGYEPINE
jgi:hypothetical protein